MNRSFTLVLVALCLAVSGCYTTQYTIPPEHEQSSYDIIGSFNVKKRASWLVLGLVPISEAQVEELVAKEVERAGGDAATNVVVTAQFDAVDVLVSALVGGLYNSRSYTLTGNVVQLRRQAMGAAPEVPEAGRSVIVGDVRYE